MINRAGQEIVASPSGQRWWFDAGSVALDFIYTSEVVTDFEDFVAPTGIGEWLGERFPEVGTRISERELEDVRSLRAAIAAIAVSLGRGAKPRADDIDIVNLYAATPDIPPVLSGASRQAGKASARPGQALSAIAREAIRLFEEESRDRVRQCAALDCQLVFFDDSRAGTRRWCSMQRCGNRAKVRAHRARYPGSD